MLSDKNYNCMKRKVILFAAGAVFLTASVVTFVSVTCSNDPMDNLFMANVEALANEETSDGFNTVIKIESSHTLICRGDGGWSTNGK